MIHPRGFIFCLLLCMLATPALAQDSFARRVDLKPLESISVQHRQTIKTFDTFSRQVISAVTGRSSLDGNPATYTVLDMAFRPEDYRSRNIIKIKSAPLRLDFQELDFISEQERQRILKEGTISLEFFLDPRVSRFLEKTQSQAVYKANAVQQLRGAAGTLSMLAASGPNFPPMAMIAPPTDDPDDHKWRHIGELAGNIPALAHILRESGQAPPPYIQGYDEYILTRIVQSWVTMLQAWRREDAVIVNEEARKLTEYLPSVAPAQYPSALKRKTEIVYNRLAKLTLPASAFYFLAFVGFLVSSRAASLAYLRKWAMALFVVALLVHTAGIGIRWWMVAYQHGSWFDGIPIKNQFESVLMSAWFGAIVGIALEMWRSRGLFGAASAFVGWMSLTAIFATPYVTGREIGGEIGQVAGILMSYWLYIHVTVVVASYALIGMSFLLSCWWLTRCIVSSSLVASLPAHQLAGDVSDLDTDPTVESTTLPPDVEHARSTLSTLDAANLVILQLAFWLLGAGIILGAVWADQSWGRPWGWDPKETFALVTWIVYLIVVHVRVATVHKAMWTAVLSIVGFFVMLFNWIGVNFFLVGLHSYA